MAAYLAGFGTWAAVAGGLISTPPPRLAGAVVGAAAVGGGAGVAVGAMREEILGEVVADQDSSANSAVVPAHRIVVASVVVALPAAVGVERVQVVDGSEIPKVAAAEAGVVGLETWVNVERVECFDSATSRRAGIAANGGAAECGKQVHPEDEDLIVVVDVVAVALADAAAADAAAAAAAGAPAPPLPASEEAAVHALATAAALVAVAAAVASPAAAAALPAVLAKTTLPQGTLDFLSGSVQDSLHASFLEHEASPKRPASVRRHHLPK